MSLYRPCGGGVWRPWLALVTTSGRNLPVEFFGATPAVHLCPALSGLRGQLRAQALPQFPQLRCIHPHDALRHRGHQQPATLPRAQP